MWLAPDREQAESQRGRRRVEHRVTLRLLINLGLIKITVGMHRELGDLYNPPLLRSRTIWTNLLAPKRRPAGAEEGRTVHRPSDAVQRVLGPNGE